MSTERREQVRWMIGLGIVAGLVGGVSEMLWIWIYSALADANAVQVAAAVAGSIGLEGTGAPVAVGVAIHLVLAAALGTVLVAVLRRPIMQLHGKSGQLAVALGALFLIWSFNFLVFLPRIDPSFVHIVPYQVSLASKLLFGLSAVVALNLARFGVRTSALRSGPTGIPD